MEIYWIKDKKRCGPASVPDVLDMVRRGDLQPDTRGWHTGVQGWHPLCELPALAGLMPRATKTEQAPDAAPGTEEPADATTPKPAVEPSTEKLGVNVPASITEGIGAGALGLPTATARLLARVIDSLLYCVLALGALFMADAPYNPYYLPGSPLFWLPMIALEALCLSKWNTTPGKRLLGIYICTVGDTPQMGYGRAFMRSFMAYLLGAGMFSFPFCVVMPAVSLWVLRKRGICWWDMRVLTFPVAKRGAARFSRVLLSLGLVYVCLVAAGVFVKPWLRPMYEEIRKEDPDTARIMLHLIPDLAPQDSPGQPPAPQPLD